MALQEPLMSSIEGENINKLLLKCIALRNQIKLTYTDSLQTFHDQETVLKHQLLEKYCQLKNQRKETLVKIELYIEKTSQSCQEPICFMCNPTWSIYTTKRKIISEVQLDALTDNVHVICQNKIAKDWYSLKECGVENDGDMLYVYLAQSETNSGCLATESISSSSEPNMDETASLSGLMKQLDLSNMSVTKSPIELKDVLLESLEINSKSEAADLAFPVISYSTPSLKYPFDVVMNRDSPTVRHASSSRIGTGSSTMSKAIVFDDDKLSTAYETVSSQPSTNTFAESKYVTAPHDKYILPLSTNVSERLLATKPEKNEVLQPTFGWICTSCTYVNQPTRPGCEMCSTPRPDDFKLPPDYIPTADEQELMKKQKYSDELFKKMQKSEEESRQQAYQDYVGVQQQNLLENNELIECSICMSEAEPGEAVKLSNCLHAFCKECLSMHIKLSDQLPVACPFVDDVYNCSSLILDREIRSLLPEDQYQCYLRKSLSAAEKHVKNSFHCKTPDCFGWCEYDDGVNVFKCPVCNHSNCLTCKVIHESMNCREYQNKIFSESTNIQAKKTKKLLKKLVKKKEAMHCPDCNIILMKKEGCDWLKCPMCQLEICWVTRQPRWGPGGLGDISGGCHCKENGKKCHPMCVNCH